MNSHSNMPDSFIIPKELVDHWISMNPDDPLDVVLTRRDWDAIYSTLDRCISAQSQFQLSMIAYTNGDQNLANQNLADAQRLLVESQNALRHLFNNVMTRTLVQKTNG